MQGIEADPPSNTSTSFNSTAIENTNQNQDDWDDGDNYQSVPETSQNNSRTSSVYSYSSQAPKNTAVGKTESIYDADYRVIVPPYQESSKNQVTDDDDWDFFEDDDFDDNNENKPQKR